MLAATHTALKDDRAASSLMARLTACVNDAALSAPPNALSSVGTSSTVGGVAPEQDGLELYSDTVVQGVQTVPLHVFSVKPDLALVSRPAKHVTSLADDPEGFRQLQRELCLLLSILQRPKEAYTYWLGYTRFLDALRTVDAVRQMTEDMQFICSMATRDAARRASNVFSAPGGEWATDWYAETLRHYSEALVLYVFNHSTHRTVMSAAPMSDDASGGETSANARAKVAEPAIAPGTASTLFRIAQRLAGELSRQHQGSALMLVCTLCTPAFQHALPLNDLHEAVAAVGDAPQNLSHLVLVSSVPYWVLCRQVMHDESAAPAGVVEWLRTAVNVCACVTIYDADVSLLFRRDGTQAPTFPLVKGIVGGLYEALWNCLAPNAWYMFNKAALWSAAKSMGIYAYAWNSVPRALTPLISLVQFQLGQFARSRAKSRTQRDATADGNSLATSGPSTSKAVNSNFNALLSGAMGVSPYEPSACSVLNSPDPDLTTANQCADAATGDEEVGMTTTDRGSGAGAKGDFTMSFSFATERAHTVYYLSLYAYVMSALPFLFERFGDVSNALQWMVPSELHERAVQRVHDEGLEDNAAATQDRLSQASGWLQKVSNFSVDVDAETSVCTADVHSHLTFPMPARFTEPGKVNLLSQLMELLTMVAQSGASDTNVQTHSSSSALLSRLAESSLALLHSLLSCYPREVSVMSRFAHVDLLSTLRLVALWQLSLPFPTFHAQELTYSLLHRYFTIFPNLQVLSTKLLKPAVLQAVGRQSGVVERLVLDNYLYTRLLECDEDASGVFVQPILAALCHVPDGAIATTTDGAQLFISAVTTLLSVIQRTSNVSLRRLFEEAPLPADVLVQRLGEGLLFLYKHWVAGFTFVDNQSTIRLLDVTLQILTQTLVITGTTPDAVTKHVMASTAEPYEPLSLVEPATCGLYAPLRLLFRPELDSLDVVERAAELVAICAARTSTTALFTTLQRCCSQELAVRMATDVVDVLRSQEGKPENVRRLEALRVVLRVDWQVFHFLAGSESLAANANAKALGDLALVKCLKDMVMGSKASRLEQAAALSLLRGLGDDDSVPLSRVSELLEQKPSNPMSNTFEVVALAAACVEHLNARTAHSMAAAVMGTSTIGTAGNTNTHQGAATHAPPLSPRQSSTGGTPSHRPMPSTPSTPRHSFTKLDREQSDAMDKACRGGTRVLRDGVQFLTLLLTDLFYEERVSLIGEPAALVDGDGSARTGLTLDVSRVNNVQLSRTGGAAFSPIVGSAARSAVIAPYSRLAQDEASLQLPSATRLHQLSRSLVPLASSSTFGHSRRSGASHTTTGGAAAGRLGNAFHTSVLPDPIGDEETLYAKPYPLVLGTTYCFQDTENDMHFNAIASAMEAMGRLSLALERTMYLCSRDPDRNTLFLARTLGTLECSLSCVLVLKPTLPLLNRALWQYMNRSLQLTLALSRSVRAAHMLDDNEFGDSLRAALDGLGRFAFENRRHLSIVNACTEVAYSIPISVFADYGTLAKVYAAAQFALVEHVKDVSFRPDVVALVHHVTMLLPASLGHCPLPSLAVLIRSLWQHTEHVSRAVVATGPARGPALLVMVTCIKCLMLCLIHSEVGAVVLTLLPSESILRMVSALGQFRRAEVYDETQRAYLQQSWHVAWIALLELLHSVILLHASAPSSRMSPRTEAHASLSSGDDWPLSIADTLSTLPRFAQAVGAFDLDKKLANAAGRANGQSSIAPFLFVWDVEETELCTRVTAGLSAVGHHMPRLFPLVQNAFVSLHRLRILRYCTATTDTRPDLAAAESRRAEAAAVRAVCAQLRVLLQWPTKALPTSQNGYPALAFPCFHDYASRGTTTGAVVHQRDVARLDRRRATSDAGQTHPHGGDADEGVQVLAEAVSLSMDVLRRFVVDELQLVRRLTALDSSGRAGRGHSPDGSSSTRPQSRESSVTRSPAFGRFGSDGGAAALHGASGALGDSLLYDDSETVATDDDSGTLLGDEGVALHIGVGAVHVECVQLALGLFTAAAAECLYGRTVITGHFDSLSFQRDLLVSVNKLLDAMDSVHKDIRKASSPLLMTAVDAMRQRLRTIKTALMS